MAEFIKLLLGWFGRPRNLQVLALILAAPAVTATTMVYLSAVVFRTWDGPQAAAQLEIIRDGVMYAHLLLFLIIGALTAGLVRSVELKAGKVGFAIDLMDDHDGTAVAKTGMMFGAESAREMRDWAEVPPNGEECYDGMPGQYGGGYGNQYGGYNRGRMPGQYGRQDQQYGPPQPYGPSQFNPDEPPILDDPMNNERSQPDWSGPVAPPNMNRGG